MDVTILGAGTTGLAAAYYAGHRGASVRIVESLEQLGGQVSALYPEKIIYDVAGHPSIQGQSLVELCAKQGLQWGADVALGEEVQTLEDVDVRGESVLAITTDRGNRFLTRTLIVTSGQGALEPRKLPLEGIDAWEGRGLHYAVREKEAFRDRACVIVGGGDAALDWALELQRTARPPVALVHRRETFRALESSLDAARALESAGRMRILAPYEVRAVHGNGRIEAVTLEDLAHGGTTTLPCEELISLLGFYSHLGAVAEWGIDLHGARQLRVDPTTLATSVPGIFAAGDAAGYPGKITLITVGMAEAAIAANNAVARVRGETVQPRYSTD
jgi:ferredoxin/flavodoxin---NADP+ reductase